MTMDPVRAQAINDELEATYGRPDVPSAAWQAAMERSARQTRRAATIEQAFFLILGILALSMLGTIMDRIVS